LRLLQVDAFGITSPSKILLTANEKPYVDDGC
jgi:hypothetical protein